MFLIIKKHGTGIDTNFSIRDHPIVLLIYKTTKIFICAKLPILHVCENKINF
jgi:hypothetical protein